MRLALSTNWSNRRLNDGAAIADEALALGFDALELGFCTRPEQLPGFRSRLDEIGVDSVHAYAPVPPGAPGGSPELWRLASLDADERALARVHLKKTVELAAELGAKAVVAHAGYAELDGWLTNLGSEALRLLVKTVDGKADIGLNPYARHLRRALKRRRARGRKLMDAFCGELDKLLPELEGKGVTLALENLPRLEGFPDAEEAEQLMGKYAGAPLKLWLDTGHGRVRESFGWSESLGAVAKRLGAHICGMHLNDVKDFHDDHRQPGWGNVDFGELGWLARGDVLRVFEPHEPVTAEELGESVKRIRETWE